MRDDVRRGAGDDDEGGRPAPRKESSRVASGVPELTTRQRELRWDHKKEGRGEREVSHPIRCGGRES